MSLQDRDYMRDPNQYKPSLKQRIKEFLARLWNDLFGG